MFRLTKTMENVTVPQPVTKFLAFYDTYSFITTFKRSPPHVPVLRQINPVPALPSFFLKIHLVLLSSHLYPGFPSGLFPSSFSTKTLHVFYLLPYRPHAQPTSSRFIWSSKLSFVRSKNQEACRYIIFSIVLILPSSWAQTSSSEPYSQIPSANGLLLIWETTFHTHIKQQAKL